MYNPKNDDGRAAAKAHDPRYGDTGLKLFRNFVIASLVAVAVILLLVGFGLNEVLTRFVVEEAEIDAVHITAALRDIEGDALIRTEQDGRQKLSLDTEDLHSLNVRMQRLLSPFEILKIKVYDRDTTILYSTDSGIIGERDIDNKELRKTLNGNRISKLESKDHVWDLDDEQRYDIDLVETYIPIEGANGTVLGAFEIYKDVTRHVEGAGQTLVLSIGILLTALVIVFGILGAMMRLAARTIHARTIALRESEKRYQVLAEVSPVGMFRANAEGDFIYVNDRWCDISGLTPDETFGEGWIRGLHPEDRERAVEEWYHAARENAPSRSEYRLRRPDGRTTWVVGQAVAETDGKGNVTGFVGTITDITERKKAEETIRRHTEILEQTVRERTAELGAAKERAEANDRAKSEFLTNMSHELRTPLHGILSFADFGIKKHAAADRVKLRDFFQMIHQSGQTLLTFLNDILDLAKLESGKMTFEFRTADLGALIRSVADEFGSLASERRLSLHWAGPEANDIVPLDVEKMKQVVRNLLSNAVKYSPPGQTIEMSMKRHNGLVRVSVRDHGPGIPRKELDAVFDKFVQSSKTKTGAGGTGLGLAICRQILTSHNGRIWAENNDDGGATLLFEMPVHADHRAKHRSPHDKSGNV